MYDKLVAHENADEKWIFSRCKVTILLSYDNNEKHVAKHILHKNHISS